MSSFFECVRERMVRLDTLLCVGIDPHLADVSVEIGVSCAKDLGGEAVHHSAEEVLYGFGRNLINNTKDFACCYKPNIAFFEAHGWRGFKALEELCAYLRELQIPILLDSKRGDIGSTAAAYAESTFKVFKAEAVTLSPYMGEDSLKPFLTGDVPGIGEKSTLSSFFVLCKTSNPSAATLQTLNVHSDYPPTPQSPSQQITQNNTTNYTQNDTTNNTQNDTTNSIQNILTNEEDRNEKPKQRKETTEVTTPLYMRVAKMTNIFNKEGPQRAGLVVGATDTKAISLIRNKFPQIHILAPGVGAQGANLQRLITAGIRADKMGLIVPISRAISQAPDQRKAASDFRDAINKIRHQCET